MDLKKFRVATMSLALELPQSVFSDYVPMVVEMTNTIELQDKALADAMAGIARLQQELACSTDAADKGDKARSLAGGMTQEIAKLQARIAELDKHVNTCPLAIKGYHDVARFYEDNDALGPQPKKESYNEA